MKALTTMAAKSAARYVASDISTKALVKYGMARVSSKVIKAAVNIANSAGIIFDLTQARFECSGYKDQGETTGKWGTIGTGASAGFAVGGPVGAAVAALVGFEAWVVG